MKERIGVYICHCGGNISDYVDVSEIAKMIQDKDGVVIAKNVMFACADSNQKEMINDIKDNKLDAIVVASCSPKLHLHTFRNVAERAGLNQFNYVQVNIREQCSWPHSDKPKDATYKAIGLIRAGIKKVMHSEALENIEIESKKAVLVVGAGVAGMRAAIDLSKSGNEVFIIEKEHFVGGRIAQTGEMFFSEKNGKYLVSRLYKELKNHKNISIFTGATLEKVSGSIGDFKIEIKIEPRYITKNAEPKLLKAAMYECHINVLDEFNLGLSSRKAIYKNYSEALPDIPVVDIEALKNENAFIDKYSDCIDFKQKPEIININVGSVLVTTGYDSYQPKDDEYAYNKIKNVITLPEFKILMEQNPETLIYQNKQINNVAFIYCVGNRQLKGENKYCSRVCCTAAIHTSIQIKENYSNIKAFHLYRDIRTYGKQEILYEKSSKQGDIYLKFDEKEPPVVEMINDKLVVKIKDYLTAKKEIEIYPDLVVLVTGMVARNDSTSIAEKLKIPIGSDKFFNEIHPKLKPVETVIKGVFIGGSCQGPKNITESVQSSLSAVAKINSLLKGETISLDPIIARINNDACTWCGKCKPVCEYDAISEIEFNGKQIAAVNKATCKGCGICAPVCPEDAIEVVQYTNIEIESMIDGFMQKIEMRDKSGVEENDDKKNVVVMKEYPQLWNDIIALISENSLSIPQIAEKTNVNIDLVTYHTMTMNKYGIIMADGMDKKEGYYYYKLKNQYNGKT